MFKLLNILIKYSSCLNVIDKTKGNAKVQFRSFNFVVNVQSDVNIEKR